MQSVQPFMNIATMLADLSVYMEIRIGLVTSMIRYLHSGKLRRKILQVDNIITIEFSACEHAFLAPGPIWNLKCFLFKGETRVYSSVA